MLPLPAASSLPQTLCKPGDAPSPSFSSICAPAAVTALVSTHQAFPDSPFSPPLPAPAPARPPAAAAPCAAGRASPWDPVPQPQALQAAPQGPLAQRLAQLQLPLLVAPPRMAPAVDFHACV